MPPFIDCSSEELCESVNRAMTATLRPVLESDVATALSRLESVASTSGLDTFIIGRSSDHYPPLVRQMDSPPAAIFGCGKFDTFRRLCEPLEDNRAVAVVGSKRASAYGREVAYSFANSRVSDDPHSVVLSTMSLGIAGAASRGALQAGGRVVAVLAGSPLIPYPRSHRLLYEQIASAGCVISCIPFIENFGASRELVPLQREFLAAVSAELVVVEGSQYSGAGDIAQAAKRFSRKVHAVPGPITSPLSQLPNSLIAAGDALCLTDTSAVSAQ